MTTNLQAVIDSAQSIEFNRTQLVASTMSRSGRIFAASRNWVRPWRFTISPKPLWRWEDSRQDLEPLIYGDRLQIHSINFSNVSWVIEYQGQGTLTPGLGYQVNDVTIASVSGNAWTFTGSGAVNDLFKPGDIFQPQSHKYPYVVKEYNNTTKTAVVDRGYIQQTGYNPVGQYMNAGRGIVWQVIITKMPTYKLLPGKLMEFSGDFEAVEVVE